MNITISKGFGGGGGLLSLLFLLSTTFLLFVQFASPMVAAASSSPAPSTSRSPYLQRRAFPHHSQSERLKKSSLSSLSASSSRRREWKTIPTKATSGSLDASNSSRNARQVPVPEIPALYSAPKIPTPEIPALYSAPEVSSDLQQDAQNEVDSGVTDQQGRATTEITIGGDEEEDETSSEDIQYGVPPTEKYPAMSMSDDPVHENDDESRSDYPTESPMPQATYLPPVNRNNDVPQASYLPPKSKSNDVPQATYLPPLSRSNDVEFDDTGKGGDDDETTEDSYNSATGYSKGNEPSAQYGPPQRNEPSAQYGPPRGNEPNIQYGPPQENSKKNGNGGNGGTSNSRKMQSPQMRGRNGSGNTNANNGRRPADQQQVENSLQPMTHHQPQTYSENSPGPQPGYLPPVYQPPQNSPPQQQQQQQQHPKPEPQRTSQHNQRQPQDQKPENQRQQQSPEPSFNSYPSNHGNEYGQQPPNSNYYTLPQAEQSHSRPEDAPTQRDESLQDLSQDVRSPSPQQQQAQGHYFGHDGNQQQQQQPQPNSLYGPPHGVNHFSHQSPPQQQQPSSTNSQGGNGAEAEEELEGLNEKIVDAELLERVQQIIEDHERQQKALLDKIQKDNERAIFSSDSESNGASGISSSFSGNELSAGNNERNSDFSPFPYYGPPPSSSSNNGNSNPTPQQQHDNTALPGTAYLPPKTSSSNNGDYIKGPEKENSPSTTRLSADVQVQKAVLSRHFTETQPDPDSQPQSSYSSYIHNPDTKFNNNSNPNKDQDDKSRDGGYSQSPHQLNDVAGPGQEYLPPRSFPRQQENPSNTQNSGYPDSFQSGDTVKAGGGEDHHGQPENGYSVKVGTGIRVTAADDVDKSTSGGSSIPYNNDGSGISTRYGPPALSPSSASTTRQYSGENNPRQDGGSPSRGALDQFSTQFDTQPNSPQQQHQQTFPASQVWSRTTNPEQHTPVSPPEQPTRYGPPSSPFGVQSNSPIVSIQGGVASPFQIKNSYERGDNVVANSNPVGGDYNQGSYSPQQPPSAQQYLSPTQIATPPSPSSQSLGSSNINGNPDVPRPIYGVPLAPVITLDSDNNLHNFNNHNHHASHSPDSHKAGPSATNYYLPPTREVPATSPQELEATGQYDPTELANLLKLHQLQQQQQPELAGGTLSNPATNYGVFPNNHIHPSSPASSSSSAYLMIQGHNGNSNNHIYNINHNGYDDPSSGSSSTVVFTRTQQQPSSSSGSLNPSDVVQGGIDDAHGSIIIPGISNTFTLPIYDYSPSHHQQLQQLQQDDELLTSSASAPVVLPFEQFLQRQQQLHPNSNIQTITLPALSSENNLRAIFYGDDDGTNRRRDNFRVSRRALSRKASITSTSVNGGSSNNNSNNNSSTTNTNNKRSNHVNQNQEQRLKHLSTPIASTTTAKTTTARNNRKRENRRQRKS